MPANQEQAEALDLVSAEQNLGLAHTAAVTETQKSHTLLNIAHAELVHARSRFWAVLALSIFVVSIGTFAALIGLAVRA